MAFCLGPMKRPGSQLVVGRDLLFADIGEVVPKGFEEPVRLYEVRRREEQ